MTLSVAEAVAATITAIITVGLLLANLRAANAANRSADLAARESYLARRPAIGVEWSGQALNGTGGVWVPGDLKESAGTPVTLHGVAIESEVERLGRRPACTGQTIYRDRVARISAYVGSSSPTTAAVKVIITMSTYGITETWAWTNLIHVTGEGTVRVTQLGLEIEGHEEPGAQGRRDSLWRKWCRCQDQIRKEMGAPLLPSIR